VLDGLSKELLVNRIAQSSCTTRASRDLRPQQGAQRVGRRLYRAMFCTGTNWHYERGFD
jgi:hypothetical protein